MSNGMARDYVSEWYRCATHSPHPVTRRQIVEVPGGYQLTPVELVGKGPESLRNYEGGWQFPSKIYPALAAAERQLIDNGYTSEMPEPGAPPEVRKRSGAGGRAKATQRAVRIPDDLWERFGATCETAGSNRNAVVNQLIDEYCAANSAGETGRPTK